MSSFSKLRSGDTAPEQIQSSDPGLPAGFGSPSPSAPHPEPSQHDIQVGMASYCGRVRERNEDASLAWLTTLTLEGQPPQSTGLFIIADGMGGHEHGAQASALATQIVAAHIIQQIGLPLLSNLSDRTQMPPIHEVLRDGMGLAHQAITRRYPKAGTTLTVALMLSESLYIAHVGDSRAYLGEGKNLQLLTKDHSVAARLLEMGQATPEEVAPQRRMLYKAVGQGPNIEPDIVYHALNWGQYLLMCCDGLWSQLHEQEIVAIVEEAPTPDIACQNLVTKANENNGDDNITVLLIARGWPLSDRPSLPPSSFRAGESQVSHGI